jgi:hypothetical protein
LYSEEDKATGFRRRRQRVWGPEKHARLGALEKQARTEREEDEDKDKGRQRKREETGAEENALGKTWERRRKEEGNNR